MMIPMMMTMKPEPVAYLRRNVLREFWSRNIEEPRVLSAE